MYLSVAILRVPQGLDCSQLLGTPDGGNFNLDVPRTLQPNESSGDLQGTEHAARNGLSGSVDSLSRNVSQGEFGPVEVTCHFGQANNLLTTSHGHLCT